MIHSITKILLVGIFSSLMPGCAVMPTAVPLSPVTPKRVDAKPEAGKRLNKGVGESLYVDTTYNSFPGFIALRSLPGPTATYPAVVAGQKYLCLNQINISDLVCVPYSDDLTVIKASSLVSLVVSPVGDFKGYYSYPYYMPVVVQTDLFNPTELPLFTTGSFKRELLYNGKNKESIKILYREFADNFSRPAFYQDLTYDLSESETIGFKDLRIKVYKATNASIDFEVSETFQRDK